jgi:hypothetical protein
VKSPDEMPGSLRPAVDWKRQLPRPAGGVDLGEHPNQNFQVGASMAQVDLEGAWRVRSSVS